MRGIRVLATGRVLMAPQLIACGERGYARLCLVSERAGDSVPVVAGQSAGVWFVAFDAVARALTERLRCGDRVRVEANIRSPESAGERWSPSGQLLVVKRFHVDTRRDRRAIYPEREDGRDVFD